MERVHLVVDINKCVGCFNCMVACKDEHVGNSWIPYTGEQQKHDQKWINPEKHERGTAPFTEVSYITKLCQHCDNAPCEKARPDAISKRPDGIVLIDAKKADDESLVSACPYGMISWNEELGTAQKCTMCAHLLDSGWAEPRCVGACPLRALSIVRCEDSEFEKLKENQYLRPLYDAECDPRVLYRNLHKFNTCFIAGAFAFYADGIERAACDIPVKLLLGGELMTEVRTDMFGEFKIDRIPKDSGIFEIEAEMPGYAQIRTEVTVADKSVCMDVMWFNKVAG